ncbi:unnamed protein product [Camellia sinensis]
MSSPYPVALERGFEAPDMPCGCCEHSRDSSDLVALNISLLGDSQIGKTSFLTMYVGGERQEEGFEISNSRLNQMDKTLYIGGEHIADETFQNQIPSAYRDSVAMLFMFDLTNRLLSDDIKNQGNGISTAIPVLIGTKFNDFVQLPIDVQWTIASQARAYARALNATLLFSRATYNINVNKIFKFITAKLFNLPWAPERNLTIGEPIINF